MLRIDSDMFVISSVIMISNNLHPVLNTYTSNLLFDVNV